MSTVSEGPDQRLTFPTQVFDAVAAELANQGIWVHLDNHMSKGKWCCNGNDGNTWFGGEFAAVLVRPRPC